jgi:hypothetical protein
MGRVPEPAPGLVDLSLLTCYGRRCPMGKSSAHVGPHQTYPPTLAWTP